MRLIVWLCSVCTLGSTLLILSWRSPVLRRILGTYLFLLALSWTLMWTAPYDIAAKPWEGPWRAQVVDAETRKPLEGVVVLAWWSRSYASPGGPAGGGYYTSQEVVTGPDGHVVIKAVPWAVSLVPFITIIEGPSFAIFKPGYGQWHFQGDKWSVLPPQEMLDQYDKHFEEINTWRDQKWAQFKGEGVVIELPPLKTWEARRRFSHTMRTPSPDVPFYRQRRFIEAWEKEHTFLFGR